MHNSIAIPDFKNPDKKFDRLRSIVHALETGSQIALVVEPSSHCNLKCVFCAPHADLGGLQQQKDPARRPKKKMNMAIGLFRQLIQKLGGMPKLKMLFFHGHGEPLVHPQLAEMVRLAMEAGVAEQATVVTNGILLDEPKFVSLVQAGVGTFRVSLDFFQPETYARFKGADRVQRVISNLDQCIRVIRERSFGIQLSIDCKSWQDPSHGQDESEMLVAHFGPLTDGLPGVVVRKTVEHNWVAQSNRETGKRSRRQYPCEQPFYMTMVHSDGDASMCCVDSMKELVLGNIASVEHFSEFVRSRQLREWRTFHLTGQFERIPACDSCDLTSSVDPILWDNRDYLLTLL